MIKSLSVAIVALLLWGPAVNACATSDVTSSHRTPPQKPEQAESARLSATVADLYKQGRYDEALPLAKRALEIEQGLGAERIEVAIALANLGELYFAKKNNSEAEKLFQQAAAAYARNQINSPPVSNVLERLAQLSFQNRKYQNAILLLERALAIQERSYGAESPQVAAILHEIANVYQVKRQYEKSEPLYLRSIAIKERILGRTNSDTVRAMKDYACLRARNAELRPAKPEVNHDLADVEIERNSIIERASCWLYGFRQDCDKLSYEPPLKSSNILNGRATRLVQPPYPVAAKLKHITGTIFVAVLIDEEGKVTNAKALCGGYPELSGAAVQAALASKFSPTKINDRAVQVTGMIIYHFF